MTKRKLKLNIVNFGHQYPIPDDRPMYLTAPIRVALLADLG